MKKEMLKSKKVKSKPEAEIESEEIEIVEECPVEDCGKVGGMLRKARIKEGKKLSDVAKDLCIRRAYLEAIEASQYSEIPPFPYGPGFVRSYANYLGLNSVRMVQLFKEETSPGSTSASKRLPDVEIMAEEAQPNKKYVLIGIGVLLAVYFVWFLFKSSETSSQEEETYNSYAEETSSEVPPTELTVEDFVSANDQPEAASAVSEIPDAPVPAAAPVEAAPAVSQVPVVPQAPAVETPSAVVAAPVAEAPAASAEPAVQPEPVALEIPKNRIFMHFKGESWIEVKDEERVYVSKVYQPGETYSLPRRPNLIVSVGRPDDVDIYIYGKLTKVADKTRRTNISLDEFINQ